MESPLAFFRHHQKVLTVILTGLAMFAFILLDTISQMHSNAVMPLLFATLGAGVFWVWGTQTKQGPGFVVTGALIGAAAGFLPVAFAAREGGITTKYGHISQQELLEMKRDRELANQFVYQAFALQENQFQFLVQTYLFGSSATPDIVLRYILLKEADRFRISVSDDRVNEFIKEVSGGKLASYDEFRKVRLQLGIGESVLFDLIKNEIRAQVAYQMLAPPVVQLPEQYWQDFRRLNVRYTIDATAVPVDAFTAAIDAPSDAELKQLFEEFRTVFPSGDKPGFMQPDRVQLAWFESNYEASEKEVGEISEADLLKRYEERKDTLYRKAEGLPDIDLGPFGSSPEQTTPDAGTPEGTEAPKSDASADTPAADTPAAPAKEDKPADSTPASNKPADDTPTTEKPTTEEPTTEKPTTEKPTTEEPTTEKPTTEKPADEKASEEAPAASKTPEGSAECQDSPATNAAPEATEPAAGTDSAEKPADVASPQDDATPADTAPADAAPADAVKLPAPAGDDAVKAPELPEPKDDGAASTTASESESEAPKVEYRPFAEVRDEIQDMLLRERTQKLIDDKLNAAVAAIREWRGELRANSRVEDEPEKQAQQNLELEAALAERAREYAEKNGLVFVESEPVSHQELVEHKEYSIGTAREPFEMSLQMQRFQNPETVASQIFGGSPALFVPQRMESGSDETRFVYWVFHEIPVHAPQWEEAGVRDQVEAAWRLQKARPKAKERADVIAGKVKEATKTSSMAEAIGEETVTGDKDSIQLSVVPSAPFSWLREVRPGMQMNPFQMDQNQPRVAFGIIPGIDGIDDNFMKTVSDLPIGDVAVIPDAAQDRFYVVQLRARNPAADSDADALRESFIREDVTVSPAQNELARMQLNRVFIQWRRAFFADHGVDLTQLANEG